MNTFPLATAPAAVNCLVYPRRRVTRMAFRRPFQHRVEMEGMAAPKAPARPYSTAFAGSLETLSF